MAVIGPIRKTPWGRPLPVSVGNVIARTYAEFVTHITELATNGAAVPSAGASIEPGAWRWSPVSSATGQFMIGSSWQTTFGVGGGSSIRAAVLHGMPSAVSYDAQASNGRQLFYRVSTQGDGPFSAVTRNGYTSAAEAAGVVNGAIMTELIYWDGTQAQRMQPSLGLGPTPYTW